MIIVLRLFGITQNVHKLKMFINNILTQKLSVSVNLTIHFVRLNIQAK